MDFAKSCFISIVGSNVMKLRTMYNIKKSIQSKIFLSFLLVIIIPTIFIGISSYIVSVDILKNKVSSSFSDIVKYIKYSIEKELDQIVQISDYIFADNEIKEAIIKSNISSFNHLKSKEEFDRKITRYSIANTFANINILNVYALKNSSFSYTKDPTLVTNDKRIRQSSYYKQALSEGGKIVWGERVNYWQNNANEEKQNSISLFRAIRDSNYKHNIGVLFINISSNLFTDLIGQYTLSNSSSIYVLDNNNILIYQSNNKADRDIEKYLNVIGNNGSADDSFFESKNGNELIVYSVSPEYDWKVIGVISVSELTKDNSKIISITVLSFMISLIVTSIIWYKVSSSILKPVKTLTKTVKKVRDGDLTSRCQVANKDEIGELSQSFNYMIQQINVLMDEKIYEQNMIKDAEYKALQAQINPHFMYNTLNSIRWMAILSKADNIKQMIDVLNRLLRSTTKTTDKFISIEEEINMLKDYYYIQKHSYSCKFEVVWDIDESALKYKCVKFILQPLFENAIFYGIVPKDGIGTIIVKVKKNDDHIEMSVKDDGAGMSQELIKQILSQQKQKKGFTGIGIRNVDKRLKITYGDTYGLKIESVLGQYTKLSIIIPICNKTVTCEEDPSCVE